MNCRDLRPLPKAAAKRVEWVKAHHEVKISEAILAWQTAARVPTEGPLEISQPQQSDLQNLLIDMSLEVANAEGRERLALSSSPQQFEMDVRELMDAIAGAALDRWNFHTAEFRLELADSENAQHDLQGRVRESLRPSQRRLIRDAWFAHEKRLEAECAGSAVPPGDRMVADSPAHLQSAKQIQQRRRESVAQRIDQLRIDRGLSVERLALDAQLDKKTVVAVLHARHTAMPSTLKKLADVLGVAASELAG
jgi:hypothetical protein